MAMLFLLVAGRVERLACPDEAPLCLDGYGRAVSAGWQVAVVPFAVAARAPRRHALVAAEGVEVAVGGQLLREGVIELRDRDHLLLGEHEIVFSTDATPEPMPVSEAPCPVCCETVAGDRRLYRCSRCGLVACARCWERAPRGVCPTPGCGRPAALERPLWEPAPADFASWEEPS
jgi:hypothetical protein